MKKILLITVIFIALFFAAIQYVAIPKAKKTIETYFQSAGFNNTKIENVAFTLNGLKIGKVILDKDGFNVAQSIEAQILWPSFIVSSYIQSIEIDTLKIASVANMPKDILAYKRHINANTLKNIAKQNITINKIIWDIATPQKALRLEGNFKLAYQDGVKVIDANLNTNQHELSFSSKWKGTLSEKNLLNLEGTYEGLGINTKSLKLKRGVGWVSVAQENEDININAQLDAGSGNIFKVPVKDINLILNQEGDAYPILLRANGSNIGDVKLFGDFKFSNDINNQAFDVVLDITDPNQFINYLTQQNILQKINNAVPSKPTKMSFSYQPENRFADGPFPFSIGVEQGGKEKLNGTYLIYPSNLDVRGTAQGEQSAIALLEALFFIDEENISDGNIRFEKNLKTLF